MKLKVIPDKWFEDEFTIMSEEDRLLPVAHIHHPTLAFQIVAALEVVELVPELITLLHSELPGRGVSYHDRMEAAEILDAIARIVHNLAEKVGDS